VPISFCRQRILARGTPDNKVDNTFSMSLDRVLVYNVTIEAILLQYERMQKYLPNILESFLHPQCRQPCHNLPVRFQVIFTSLLLIQQNATGAQRNRMHSQPLILSRKCEYRHRCGILSWAEQGMRGTRSFEAESVAITDRTRRRRGRGRAGSYQGRFGGEASCALATVLGRHL
jgi:hypothetical protein